MPSAADRSFFWRRLHSFSGIFPVGAFLLEHLYTNLYAVKGAEAYGEKVQGLASLPLLPALEIVFIYIPIAYHALYGIRIWWNGQGNLVPYGWAGNWLYSLQRWTGLIAFAYIGFHVWEQRFSGAHILSHPFVAFSKVQHSIAAAPVFAFYVAGLLAACFHFSYGVWLFAAKWGFVPGAGAQKRLLWACAGLFLLLSGVGLASLGSIASAPVQPAPEELIRSRSKPPAGNPDAAAKRDSLGSSGS